MQLLLVSKPFTEITQIYTSYIGIQVESFLKGKETIFGASVCLFVQRAPELKLGQFPMPKCCCNIALQQWNLSWWSFLDAFLTI